MEACEATEAEENDETWICADEDMKSLDSEVWKDCNDWENADIDDCAVAIESAPVWER